MKKSLFAGLLCAVLGLVCVLSPVATAATLTVTNANDSGPGSLREAISLASNGDQITFDASLATIPIVLTSGELLIDKNLTITGLGQDQTILDGNATSRIFKIVDPASVTISMLTVRNGFWQEIVPGQYGEEAIAEGGGVYNSGTLTLKETSIQASRVSSRVCDENSCSPYSYPSGLSIRGGGIFNSGTLHMIRGAINQNEADGDPAYGGGIYNSGEAILSDTEISGNFGYWDRASGLQGVGVFNENSGSMVILDSMVAGNSVGASPAIVSLGTLSLTRTTITGNGYWLGGGLFNQGTATLLETTVSGNWSGAGGGQYGVAGGITNAGSLTVASSTISYNTGEGSGGVNNLTGVLRIINSTISYNEGHRGAGGVGSDHASPGAAVIVENSTIVGNRWGGIKAWSPAIFQIKGSVIAGNTLEGSNEPEDCEGSITTRGNNIIGTGNYCQGFGGSLNGDVVGADRAQLLESSLADNGGPTHTVALLPNSPAIDAIPPDACTDDQGDLLTSDQRGVPRPQGAGCDVGAFEFSLPRGAGFWAHQCSDKGFKQVSATEMEALFAKAADNSSVFPECAPINCDFLMPQAPKNDMRARAQQRLLDVWLNLSSGRLTRGRPIDLAGLTSATTVGEAISELELTVCNPLATHSDLVNAKNIAEALNSSTNDMELAAAESSMALLPGASRTMVLGLINLSPGNRNYSLTVSGPWPVRLSTARINALGSGEVAQITATITAPLNAQATDGQFRITAIDLLTQGTLKRDVTIKVRLTGGSTFQPVQKPTKVD